MNTRRDKALVLTYPQSPADLKGPTSMPKERKPNKEVKKQPAMTPKERKAMKKLKKDAKKSQNP